jgi:putative tryptophan/tyrosine transport system substrate-binding protein
MRTEAIESKKPVLRIQSSARLRRAMRKTFLFLSAIAVLGAAAIVEAQEAKKVHQIGFLCPAKCGQPEHDGFLNAMRQLGYTEGRDIVMNYRAAESDPDRLSTLVTELVRLKMDVIVTASTPAILAAKQATNTIPIVFASAGDPVGLGLVASLAKPGGNVTGITILSPELSGKRLELLKETVPRLSRVAVLSNAANPAHASLDELETAAPAVGLTLQFLKAQRPSDLETVFSAILRERSGALVIIPDAFFASQRSRFVEFGIKNRLPIMYDRRDYVEEGGLMSYGIDFRHQFQRAAYFVDKIFKGAKPADLPVEQPTKFELVINLKTAKQIGLTIPPNVLARADKVIK